VQLIHKSPLGALEIPTVLGAVEPGVPFDVDDDIAESLLEQDELYLLAPAPPETTVKELREIARDKGIDITGLKTKPEITAALAAADAEEAQQ
jgi:hypothetical protein